MKTYRLKTNICISDFEREKYNIDKTGAKYGYLRNYDGEYGICDEGSFCYEGEYSRFTQDELDLIPNGLFKKFDVIEIEEDKYNIICPVTSHYLVIDKETDTIYWLNTSSCDDNGSFQKQFTASEIERKFKCYANETFMVKNNSK